MVYLDSSAIVRLYAPQADTPFVAAYVRGLKSPLPFTHLHEIEVKNALRLKVFRREADSRRVLRSIRAIEEDLTSQLLNRPQLSWPDVFRRADELSKQFTSRSGSRSLDLLHVACCLLLGCRDFFTFDDRQATLAKKAKLRLVRLPATRIRNTVRTSK